MFSLTHNNKDGSRNSFVDHIPHYVGLEWRLDAIVGSRALPSLDEGSQVYPIITMKLKLHSPRQNNKPLSFVRDEERHQDQVVLLQTDPVNLCHITDVLENALKEARSQQFRKLKRQV